MSSPHNPSSPSSGGEARDAVAAVLQDQADRARRREEPSPKPPDRGPLTAALFAVLMAATVWVLLAPPAFLRPSPPPAPSADDMEAGLRMDLFVAALGLGAYHREHGSYPATLSEALEDPEDGRDLTYETAGSGYRLIGQRDTFVVVYESTEPLRHRTNPAIRVVTGEGGS